MIKSQLGMRPRNVLSIIHLQFRLDWFTACYARCKNTLHCGNLFIPKILYVGIWMGLNDAPLQDVPDDYLQQ